MTSEANVPRRIRIRDHHVGAIAQLAQKRIDRTYLIEFGGQPAPDFTAVMIRAIVEAALDLDIVRYDLGS